MVMFKKSSPAKDVLMKTGRHEHKYYHFGGRKQTIKHLRVLFTCSIALFVWNVERCASDGDVKQLFGRWLNTLRKPGKTLAAIGFKPFWSI